MRLPKVANPVKKEDYMWVDKAGANLRRFMLDILDGDNLYQTTNPGKQKEFINKYFGDVDTGGLSKVTNSIDVDTLKIQKAESSVKTTEIKFLSTKSIKSVISEGSIVSFKGKNKDDKDIQRHFFIKSIGNDGYIYLIMSNSFGKFERYIDRLDGKRSFRKGDFSDLNTTESDSKYTRIKKDDFSYLLKLRDTTDDKINIKYIDSSKNIKEENITVLSSYWLTKAGEKTPTIFKADHNQLNSIIDQLGDKSNVQSFVSDPNIKITKI